MTLPSWRTERDDAVAPRGIQHLSHSRIDKYLRCPEQYRFYYLEHLRPVVPSASLVFGSIIHQALAALFQKKGDPVKHFLDGWGVLKDLRLEYSYRESWDKLRIAGEILLQKFVSEEVAKLGTVRAVEKPFTFSITTLDVPFVGVLDLDADLFGKATVIDFKTSGGQYDEHEVALSDQLTAYQMAEPTAAQVAFCVLVKTKEAKIVWHVAERGGAQLMEYLAKVGYVAREIAAGSYYKRSGMWCAWCDFLPLCLGQRQKASESLVAIA